MNRQELWEALSEKTAPVVKRSLGGAISESHVDQVVHDVVAALIDDREKIEEDYHTMFSVTRRLLDITEIMVLVFDQTKTKLTKENKAAYELLKKLEWSVNDTPVNVGRAMMCGICGNYQIDGHTEDCELNLLIKDV